jgi:hypothetical protein
MENKYFTPDIEDIHVGYECELLMNTNVSILNPTSNAPEFKPFIFEKNKIELLIELYDSIRVPYLTKEQIEAEGWKFDYNLGDFDYYIKTVNNTEYELEFCYKERININIWKRTLYHGECKDINTFRKIIKLLEI